MPYSIKDKLVIGISSRALFNLTKETGILEKKGLREYKRYQINNRKEILKPGGAFHFIKKILDINNKYSGKPIEVVLLSKNSPETGIRVLNSIKYYGLDITRSAFTSGKLVYKYIPAFNISLFLSADETDVQNAIKSNYPAGRLLNTDIKYGENMDELLIAFDFDGVIVDREAQDIYEQKGIDEYYKYEEEHKEDILQPGPLAGFFKKIAYFQKLETREQDKNSDYKKILRTAIITARNAPAHERAINTLTKWGGSVDEMFLLGGINKKNIIEIMKPHVYFDDDLNNLNQSIKNIPLVHIPVIPKGSTP